MILIFCTIKLVFHASQSKTELKRMEIDRERERERKRKYGETKLDRTQGNDENTSQNWYRTVSDDLRWTHQTWLPRTHTVPAPSMQKWLPQIPSPIITLFPETHSCPLPLSAIPELPAEIEAQKSSITSNSTATPLQDCLNRWVGDVDIGDDDDDDDGVVSELQPSWHGSKHRSSYV